MLFILVAHNPCADVNLSSFVSLSAPLASQCWHHHCIHGNQVGSVYPAQLHPGDSWEQLLAAWDPGAEPPQPAAGLPGKHCAHLVKPQWFKAATSNRLSAEIQTELEQKARWPVTPFFQTSSEFKYCGVKLTSLPYLHPAGCFREASGRMAHVFTQVLLTFIFINFPL